MKTKKHQMRILSATAMLLMLCMMLSCAVQPHAKASGASTSSKTIVAKPVKPENGKRTQTVRISKNGKAKEQSTKAVAKDSVAVAVAEKRAAKDTGEVAVAQKPVAIEPERRERIPAPARVSVPNMDYRLGFGDVFDVKFLGSSEYNESVSVRPDGKISLQGIGDVDVVGLTPAELDTLLTSEYTKILVKPNITVIVKAFGGQTCYVAGEVEKPGAYDLAKGMTLLRAIAGAGGHKKTGKLSSIILIRLDDEKRAEATRVDLSFSSLSKNLSRDIPVHANDIIYVPRTFIADLNAFMSQIYDLVLPPFDSWARFYYFQEVVK